MTRLQIAKQYLRQANDIKENNPQEVTIPGTDAYMSYMRALLGHYENLTDHLDDGYHEKQWNAACNKRDKIFNELRKAIQAQKEGK